MASKWKREYYKYQDRKKKDPSFRSFINLATNEISTPIDNSFIHINGTSPNIVERSSTILKKELCCEQHEHETDCIIVNNSKFYSTVKEQSRKTLQKGKKDHTEKEDFPDGIANVYTRPSLKPKFSFRNTSFIESVRGSSFDGDEENLDLDSPGSPEVFFGQCKLTLQKTVAEKYKLGDLVGEMDDRFFDMTEDERMYQLTNRCDTTETNISLLTMDRRDSRVEIEDILPLSTTPPPPPKPIRKNSQKRIEQTVTSNEKANE